VFLSDGVASAMRATYAIIPTPIGDLVAWGEDHSLRALEFADSRTESPLETGWKRDDSAFGQLAEQLRAYFAGELTCFDLTLETGGTPFQRRVWDALQKIPYGTTTTYGALAAEIGQPRAVRAVGAANGRNPISIVVPCHRLVGADGSLTGYGGGLERKRWLLEHERATATAGNSELEYVGTGPSRR
jgi:methylated-DNA-[protein]-cysteine S-methyltransferase